MLARIWSREIGGGGRFIQSKHFCLLFLAGARTGWGGDGEKKKKKKKKKKKRLDKELYEWFKGDQKVFFLALSK